MEVIEIREFEDRDGKKIERIFRGGLREITLLEPSQEYIDTQIKPRIEASNRHREEVEKHRKKMEKFEKWLEENFGDTK